MKHFLELCVLTLISAMSNPLSCGKFVCYPVGQDNVSCGQGRTVDDLYIEGVGLPLDFCYR